MYIGYKACNIIDKGDVDIKLSNNSLLKLKDVRHVSCLKKNLISISQLAQSKYMNIFTGNSWNLSNVALVMTCTNIDGSFYLINQASEFV